MKYVKKIAIPALLGLFATCMFAGCGSRADSDTDSVTGDTITQDTSDIPDTLQQFEVDVDTSDKVFTDTTVDVSSDTSTVPKPDPGVGRKAAPNFTLQDLSGKQHSLTSYKGKVVLLDFWATWCGPCKQEIPYLVAIYNSYKSQGYVTLGIGLDKKANLERYLAKSPITYTILVDEKNSSSGLYNVSGIPRTILIDKKGRIAGDHTGFRPGMEKEIEAEVIELLAEEY